MITNSSGPFSYGTFSTKWHRDLCRVAGLKARAALYTVSLGTPCYYHFQNVRSHAKEHRCQLMNRLPLAKTGTTERQKEWWMWSIETHQIYKIPEFTVTTRGGEAWRERGTETERQTQGTRLNWKLQNTNFTFFETWQLKGKECLPL